MAGGEHELPDSLDWLVPGEIARLGRFRFTKRRREYLLRRWTAKRAVARWLDLDLDDGAATLSRIGVGNHPGGAPFVELDGRPAPLDVSLTDRAGWAVCLVGPPGGIRTGTLGVDLELVEPRSDGFIADFLTDGERRYVAALGDDARHEAANVMWSAKEAALKVLQVGLRADTRSVEVHLEPPVRPDGWAAMSLVGVDGDRFSGWWRRDGVFVLTIATRGSRDPPAVLPGGADLAGAVPTHTWLDDPLV
jgi:4'-phosphopantetheinyl transferase